MNTLDIRYILLQFKEKIYLNNGLEFQHFFEEIMEKFNNKFEKIRPYGKKGDGGNDGWIRELGIYYQVYSPNTPKINENKAASKLEKDFEKLKKNWDGISAIKKYYFVFNDKYLGTVSPIEETLSFLRKSNPNIEFDKFLSSDLEKIFLKLRSEDYQSLGFDLDSRESIKRLYSILELCENEIKKKNLRTAKTILQSISTSIKEIDEDNLVKVFDYLDAKCLQEFEEYDKAKEKYFDINVRFPNEIHALLSLAEIYLKERNFQKNLDLIKKAELVNSEYWLVHIEKIIRSLHLGEKIEESTLSEKNIPPDKKIKAIYYRIYAIIYETLGQHERADSYIQKAIYLEPDNFTNHLSRLTIIRNRLYECKNDFEKHEKATYLLTENTKIEEKYLKLADLPPRARGMLNINRLISFLFLEDIVEFEKNSKETFGLLLDCWFDVEIEGALIELLQYICLPKSELERLIGYVKKSQLGISDDFSRLLILQFDFNNTLLTDGKRFFEDITNKVFFDFITNFEEGNLPEVINYIKQDIRVIPSLSNTINSNHELRNAIILILPDDEDSLKIKLSLLVNYSKGDFNDAFDILQKMDLSKLNYFECRNLLELTYNKQAWDFRIVILKKLLEKEKDENIKLNLKLQLFDSFKHLQSFTEVSLLGLELIQENYFSNRISEDNLSVLICNTLLAFIDRGKVDNSNYLQAMEIMQTYPIRNKTFESCVAVEAEVFINNKMFDEAFNAIIEGVKIKKVLSPIDFAKLYFILAVEIGNQLNINLETAQEIEINQFVKVKNKDKWYFIGDECELDAISIRSSNPIFQNFINKLFSEKIKFSQKYNSTIYEEEIEYIFPIKKYIFWKTINTFHELAKEGILEGVQSIEIPKSGDSINPENLLRFFEDIEKNKSEINDLYYQNTIPLAILTLFEGDIIQAIGKIQDERKGFINFCSNNINDLLKQEKIAIGVIENKSDFIIDGTSALFLSESGLLPKIIDCFPNMKVPQSVIHFLIIIADKINFSKGTIGYIKYSNKQLIFSKVQNNERQKQFHLNIINSIKCLENNRNIVFISSANKVDCFSEQKIHSEFCDAAIIAQKLNIPILSDDYLYGELNAYETHKKSPEYFSSFFLIKTLFEKKVITLDEYLDYFYFLTSYRFRFLPLKVEDIRDAIFGKGIINLFRPENIKKLNLNLIISEDYGVPLKLAITLISNFIFSVVNDSTITIEMLEKIVIEILECFPTKLRKFEIGLIILKTCNRLYESSKSKLIFSTGEKDIASKFEAFKKVVDLYKDENRLWTPNSIK